MNLAHSFVNYAELRTDALIPTHPERGEWRFAVRPSSRRARPFDTYLRVRHGQTARLSTSLARSGKQLALSPSPPPPTQAPSFLSRARPPRAAPRCAKRRPCNAMQENIIEAIVQPLCFLSFPLFFLLQTRFFISCFFRGHRIDRRRQQTQTTGKYQPVHPSSPLFSMAWLLPWICSSSSDCLRCSNEGDDGRLHSTPCHPCELK